jgi:sirohydrochlorin ferrochelatase
MHALIVAAHGSRRQASNQEVQAMGALIAEKAANRYQQVATAFLELAEPSIEDALRASAAAGATHITLVPYLLAAGRHVVEDIPAAVENVREHLHGIDVSIAPHIGASPLMADLVLACADAP